MKSPLRVFVTRLLSNELGLAVCAVLANMLLLDMFPNHAGFAVLAVYFMMLLNMMIQYSVAWKMGERDRNLVKYNHMTYQPHRGLIAGLISLVLPLAAVVFVQSRSPSTTYIGMIVCLSVCPLLSWFAYLNGHKLKRYGISIVYRKKR